MSKQEVSDYLLERLRAWGVEHVFGYPGDGINGLLAAWGRADNKPQFIQSRHEEMSAFQAVGYAKFTGRVGVCAATSGPGAIHLLNGLYDAKLDHVPVVAIVGQTNRTAMGGNYQQEVDLLSLFKDVASDYVQMVTVPEQLPNVLDRADPHRDDPAGPTALIIRPTCRSCRTRRRARVQDGALQPGHRMPGHRPGGRRHRPRGRDPQRGQEGGHAGRHRRPRGAPGAGRGRRPARRRRGQGAVGQGRAVRRIALGHRLYRAFGHAASYELMRDCDNVAHGRIQLPYTQFLPECGQCRAVQIDIDGRLIGMRYPYEVNLVADAKAALRALIPHLKRKEDRSWREGIEKNVARWWETMDKEAMVGADPINPLRLFSELSPLLPDNAIVTADSGSSANWYARNLRFRGNMRGSLSGTRWRR
ncbi:thiamine pyrophosphate enzyme, N-terminal TPP binding domain protein [Mycobacterium avium MAV_061107_1842]|nr:thiamine pyrophosphate enzyme, N-terminal TPP binding domain protein [Mycobacterium avium MAV_061107_1842]